MKFLAIFFILTSTAFGQINFRRPELAPLPSGCPYRMSGEQLEGYMGQSPDTLIARAREQGPACGSRVAEAFVHHIASFKGVPCTGGSCSPWSANLTASCSAGEEVCQAARELQNAQAENLRRLVAVSLSQRDLGPEEIARLCQQLTPANPLELIRQQGIQEILAEMDCPEIPIGQARSFQSQIAGQNSTYTLNRIDQSTYRMDIPIEFTTSSNTIDQSRLREFRQYVSNCIDEYNDNLTGPNGERLSIRILDPDLNPATAGLPRNIGMSRNTVQVWETLPRENSGNYSLAIPCSTVLHEVLHLTGLVDEYPEDDPDLGYGCRIRPERLTIMGSDRQAAEALPSETNCVVQPQFQTLWNQVSERERALLLRPQLGEILFRADFCVVRPETERLALSEALARPSLNMRELERSNDSLSFEAYVPVLDPETSMAWMEKRTIDCRCTRGDPKCRRWISDPPTRTIDLTNTRTECPAIMSGNRQRSATPGTGTELTPTGMLIRRRGALPSLLSPNQFNRILAGNCQRRSNDYNVCASWAYVSDCAPPQSDCFGSPGECSGPPTQCTDDRFLGTVRSE